MIEDPIGQSTLKRKDAIRSLRHVFQWAWGLDREPAFTSLVRAIDDLDREQIRRRKRHDVGLAE